MRPSLPLTCSRFDHLYMWRDLALRNQPRPVGDYLFDLGPTAGETGHCGWASQDQRRDLFRESLDGDAILTAHAYTQLHFRQIARGLARQRSVRRIRADKLRQDLIEMQTKSLEPRPPNP